MIPQNFFESLFPDSPGYLAVSYMKGPNDRKKLVVNNYFDLSDLEPFYAEATDRSLHGWDCYFVPAVMKEPKRTKDAFDHSHVAWVDLDSKQPPSQELDPSFVVQSSPGKYHLYWKLTEPVDGETVESINRTLAKGIAGDMSGWDRTQLLRVPGTLNYKYSVPEPVSIASSNALTYSPSVFPLILGSMKYLSQRL